VVSLEARQQEVESLRARLAQLEAAQAKRQSAQALATQLKEEIDRAQAKHTATAERLAAIHEQLEQERLAKAAQNANWKNYRHVSGDAHGPMPPRIIAAAAMATLSQLGASADSEVLVSTVNSALEAAIAHGYDPVDRGVIQAALDSARNAPH
jgi:predicted  nucleic acid-binding Zn-ribbon protein